MKKCGICLHCIGALDGNYIKIECPSLGGPLYHKYKGKFGIVLVNMCDIYCLFTWFRSNQYEKQKWKLDACEIEDGQIVRGQEKNLADLQKSF